MTITIQQACRLRAKHLEQAADIKHTLGSQQVQGTSTDHGTHLLRSLTLYTHTCAFNLGSQP